MVIYDLQCELLHEFEGWFDDSNDLENQKARGLLTCPVCESANVRKKVTASKVARKSNSFNKLSTDQTLPGNEGSSAPTSIQSKNIPQTAATYEQVQKALKNVHNYVDKNFTDVGNKFAEEALKIHKGEKNPQNIRGTVSKGELKELAEEGVSALPLPPKPDDKDKLN